MVSAVADNQGPVTVEGSGAGVFVVTLSRPETRNALSRAAIAALDTALDKLATDAAVKVVILTGAGGHFAAGADLAEIAAMSAQEAEEAGYSGSCHRLAGFPKPVVAAVEGYALGGGCELVEMCDIVVASQDAIFGHPELRVGTMPGAGGTQRLVRTVGRALAMDMLLTARLLDAEAARAAGLVSRVVSAERLMDEAHEAAYAVAGRSAPAARLIKQAVNAAQDRPLGEGLARERLLFHRSLALDDRREGVAAFLERRAPEFRDR